MVGGGATHEVIHCARVDFIKSLVCKFGYRDEATVCPDNKAEETASREIEVLSKTESERHTGMVNNWPGEVDSAPIS